MSVNTRDWVLMPEEYIIPAQIHRTEIVVVNSRFITTISPVSDVAAAREFISSIRSEMPDANHHVYAFRVGFGQSVIEGMSDDGEPSGTSGPPTLAVLRGSGIGDIVLVTTRFFGGTKLGTGGLVRAYSDSARESLASLPTRLKVPYTRIGVDRIPYSVLELVRRQLDTYQDTSIDDETYTDVVTFIITMRESDVADFVARVIDITSGQAEIIQFE